MKRDDEREGAFEGSQSSHFEDTRACDESVADLVGVDLPERLRPPRSPHERWGEMLSRGATRFIDWGTRHAGPLKVACVLYFGAMLVSFVASAFVGFGLPALVVALVAGMTTGPFLAALALFLLAVGIEFVLFGDSAALRVFCVFETIACFGFIIFFVWGQLATFGNATLDLLSAPVEASAVYESYYSDDDGPNSMHASVTVGDRTMRVNWTEEVADQLEELRIGEGDEFRVWVYPHTGIPVSIVNPAEYR